MLFNLSITFICHVKSTKYYFVFKWWKILQLISSSCNVCLFWYMYTKHQKTQYWAHFNGPHYNGWHLLALTKMLISVFPLSLFFFFWEKPKINKFIKFLVENFVFWLWIWGFPFLFFTCMKNIYVGTCMIA